MAVLCQTHKSFKVGKTTNETASKPNLGSHRIHARHRSRTSTQMEAGGWLETQLRNIYKVGLKYLRCPQEGEQDRRRNK